MILFGLIPIGTIIGQYKVDSGSIFLSQKDITEKPIHERAKLGIGYLSQYRAVFNMDTYSNLMGVAELCIKKDEQRRLVVEKLMNGHGRILVRKSGTESKIRVMGESENKDLLNKCINIISNKIK